MLPFKSAFRCFKGVVVYLPGNPV